MGITKICLKCGHAASYHVFVTVGLIPKFGECTMCKMYAKNQTQKKKRFWEHELMGNLEYLEKLACDKKETQNDYKTHVNAPA